MGNTVECYGIVIALFKGQYARTVLPPEIESVAVTPYIEIQLIVQDIISAATVHSDP